MIDFHTHILPGIDDGSQNMEESQRLIRAESEDGVTTIIATPHFDANSMAGTQYLKNRAESEAKVRAFLTRMSLAPNHRSGADASLAPDHRTRADASLTMDHRSGVDASLTANNKRGAHTLLVPELRVGAEVYYFPGMATADILDDLCIQGTKTLMVEMPFTQWTESIYKDIQELVYKRRFQVILAHVERYVYFQRKKDVWNAVMALPLTKQINAGSFIKKGLFDKKPRWAMNFLKEHDHVVIGSDCHNMTSRKPNLLAGRQAIEKTLGKDRLKRIDEEGIHLL